MLINCLYCPGSYNSVKMKGNNEIKEQDLSSSASTAEKVQEEKSDLGLFQLEPIGRSTISTERRNRIRQENPEFYLTDEQMKFIHKKMKEKVGNYFEVPKEEYIRREIDPDKPGIFGLPRLLRISEFGKTISDIIYNNFNGLVDENGNKISPPPKKVERGEFMSPSYEYSRERSDLLASEFMERLSYKMLSTAIAMGNFDYKKSYELAKLANSCLTGAMGMRDRAEESDEEENWVDQEIPLEVIQRPIHDIMRSQDYSFEYRNSYGDSPIGSDKFKLFYADKSEPRNPVRFNKGIAKSTTYNKDNNPKKSKIFRWIRDIIPLENDPSSNLACVAVAPFIKFLPPEERSFGFKELLSKVMMNAPENSGNLAIKELYSALEFIPDDDKKEIEAQLKEKAPDFKDSGSI